MLNIQNVSAYFNPIFIVSGYFDGATNNIVTSGDYFPVPYVADDFSSYLTGFIISVSGSGVNGAYWLRSGIFINKSSYIYDDLNSYDTGIKNDYLNPTLLNGNIFYLNYNNISGGLTGFIKSDPFNIPNRGLIYNTFNNNGTLVSGNLNLYGITTRENDQYIIINGSSGNFNNDSTLEVLINKTGNYAPGGSFIIGNSIDSGIAIIGSDTGNFIQIFIGGQEIDTDVSITDNSWNHIAITNYKNGSITGSEITGYSFITGGSFDFVDISGVGIELIGLQNQDEGVDTFSTTGFVFNFYDMTNISTFWAQSNGFISFVDITGDNLYSIHPYGTNDGPHSGFIQPYSIGPFWTDLISQNVYYQEYPDHLIIQYIANLFSDDPSLQNVFEISLWNNGKIFYYYSVLSGTFSVNDTAIGIQQSGRIGLGVWDNIDQDPPFTLESGVVIEIDPIFITNSYTLNIYKDGIQNNSYNLNDINLTDLNNISCGKNLNLSSGGFNGIFDEIRLWNYTRESGDITNNYNQKLDFYSSGLLYYLSI